MKLSVYKLLIIFFLVNCYCTYGQVNRDSFYHVVKTGDNLYRISLKYNVPEDSIRKWNNLDHSYMVKPGQHLLVSGGKAVMTETEHPSDKGSPMIPDRSLTSDQVPLSDSLAAARQDKFIPLYSQTVESKGDTSFYGTLLYYYKRSNILFEIIFALNLAFILSVFILLIVILIRRLMDGFDELKREECKDRYRNYIADWLFKEQPGDFPRSFKKEFKEKVYRDFFTSELLSLHANLTGESAEKLIGLYHFAGLKEYSILKIHNSSWHVKAKGFRELAQMKITEENELISNYLNSSNSILRIEAQLAWIQLNPDDPLSFLDNPDILLTEWGLLNSLHSLKKIDKIPDFGRWLQSSNKGVSRFAIKMTGIFKQFDNVEMVTQQLQNTDPDIRLEAITALGKMEVTSTAAKLKQLFTGEEVMNKTEIVRSLVMISDSQNISFFEEVIRNETDINLRILAARGLVSLNGKAIERLDSILEAADPLLKMIIIHAKDDRI